ncbi:hypothetical protein C2S51_013375 [Perilla frutescens var. frutescens]|nr:hypothetical protein C2S51_013375 [Perilla frutescens var. frutescens]
MTSSDKLNNSQILKVALIAALLIVTPLLSASLRSTYLYFVANILIVVVGAEAGLLSFFFNSPPSNKPHAIISELENSGSADQCSTTNINVMKKCSFSDKIIDDVGGDEEKINVMMIEKSDHPSTASIFFIGDQSNDDEREEEVGEVSGQELFQKAETFIGNFYKQLKMQREDSWKKLHDLYHKAF